MRDAFQRAFINRLQNALADRECHGQAAVLQVREVGTGCKIPGTSGEEPVTQGTGTARGITDCRYTVQITGQPPARTGEEALETSDNGLGQLRGTLLVSIIQAGCRE